MNIVKEFLKGILIGVANIIPGVSGGTMAVSMGVYDKIIKSITGMSKNFKKSILTLLPYVIGAATGIGILSFVVRYVLSNYPMQTSGLFIGLIMGGLPILVKQVKGARFTAANIIAFAVFFCIVTGMAFLSGNESSTTDIAVNLGTVVQLFFIGVIASATMIIPGVSGSLVMMICGFYGIIISNISNFISSLLHFDKFALIHGFGVLFPFGLGVLVGIGLVAKLIEILFAKVPVLTYCAILGLIVGSPIAIIYKAGISSISILGASVTVVTFCAGFAISFFLGRDENTEPENVKLES
ncbi:DUF368 domain-containing protein [Anaerocolumna aminovalerica]|uniref:DUF368 domain-containing protein n=1 Tax=Anaerocolumna aminovalerica TaxID=1527 RepID=UPI000BE28D5C|nr:DUF368 domain-containing protein [Anaerocolumna aminovalerica]